MVLPISSAIIHQNKMSSPNSKSIISALIIKFTIPTCIIVLILSVLFPRSLSAQDNFQWYVRSHALASSHDLVPLWLRTNKYGMVNNYGNGELSVLAGAKYQTALGKKIDFTFGMEGYASNQWNYKALSQLYAEFKWGPASLIVGKRNIDFLNARNQQLPYMDFRNIRPFPYFSFGFYDYTNIPLLKGYLQFKATFVQGILNDDRDAFGEGNPLYHFKSLYAKTGNFPLQLFIGMNHGVIFGGTYQDTIKIPVDFFNTYLINASEKVGKVLEGEGMNKPGEHLGFVDMGAILDLKKVYFDFTFQNIFTDYSGFVQSDDHNLIFNLEWKGKHPVSKLNYEYGYTVHQSGIGLGNRRYETITNYTDYLSENFNYQGEAVTNYEEFTRILYSYTGSDGQYSGRDDYFNNYIYPLGHFYDSHFFGYPLMHSKQQIGLFKDEGIQAYETIGNNRIKSHHFAAEGWISDRLKYSAKATFTNNFGTYSGFYAHDFVERGGYYFRDGKKQNYFLLELEYTRKKSPLNFTASLGIDTGELYDSYGVMLGVSYSGESIIRGKRSRGKTPVLRSPYSIWSPFYKK